MRETLEKFVHSFGFPLATEIGKLGLLYLTIEPGNADLIDKYLFTSLALDGIETFCRSSFWPYSEIPFSYAERHLVYDAPKLLVKAGGMVGDIFSEIYTNTKDNLGAWWDSLKGR